MLQCSIKRCVCRHIHGQLTHAVHQAVVQFQGNECLLLAVEALQEAAAAAVKQAKEAAAEKNQNSKEPPDTHPASFQIGRRAIWLEAVDAILWLWSQCLLSELDMFCYLHCPVYAIGVCIVHACIL